MKLIYYIIIRISLVLSVLLTGWAILFYFTVMDEVNDEVDDSLAVSYTHLTLPTTSRV
mgnify:CR=1 FL=1